MSNFSFAKKRVGAYFNDGEVTQWVQFSPELGPAPTPNLIKAVRAARAAFNRVWIPVTHTPSARKAKAKPC